MDETLENYNNFKMDAFGLDVYPMTSKLMLKRKICMYYQRQLIGVGGGGDIKTNN